MVANGKFERERDMAIVEKVEALTQLEDIKAVCEVTNSINKNLLEEKTVRENYVINLCHDLRNPIGCIKSALEALHLCDNVDLVLPIIDRAASRAEKLIVHLLDANQIQSGEIVCKTPELFSIQELLSRCIECVPRNDLDRIRFVNVDDSIQLNIDIFSMERAIVNLISNALKYSYPLSEVTISADRHHGHVRISVHNHGEAISIDDQKRLFERQFRSDATRHKIGWGLGLHFVRSIAEFHHGEIRVESDVTKGTTFTLELPLLDALPDYH